MSTTRLLLPFTGRLDVQALDYAIKLAQYKGASLILLSLIVEPLECEGGRIRLEQIQQSKDFLVLATSKARRAGVLVESHEIYTYDALHTLTLLAQEQMCNAILLFVRDKQGALLQDSEVKRVLEWQDIASWVIYIPATACRLSHVPLWTRLTSLRRKPPAEEIRVYIRARHADRNTHPSLPGNLSK